MHQAQRGILRRLPAALLAVVALAATPGCGEEPGVAAPGASPRAGGSPAAAVKRVLGRAPAFALTDQDGKRFDSQDLFGRVWIATFMFTKCRGTCPTQTARLRELDRELAAHPKRADLEFVSISVDPEVDTPAVLRSYAQAYELDLTHWTFLTGTRHDTWLMSTAGFLLPTGEDPSNESMPISHSANFILVDRRGLVRGHFDSQTAEGVAALRAALGPVLDEPAPERVVNPPDALEPPWLESRRRDQIAAAKSWSVVHDFGFRDRRRESGIRFVNRIVDDGGRNYLAVHYDHGNGVAVADVDGDGRLDLYFTNQVGSNQLWRNLGGGRFEDVTREAGVALKAPVCVAASFADTDNDGDPDLFVTTVREGNYLFENDGKGHFTDVTERAGVGHVAHSSTPVFFDFDRDGLLDVFLCNVGRYSTDTRVPVIDDSTTAGLEPGEFSYYRGVLDAFSGHLKPERNEVSLLYRNLGGNRFQDVHARVGLMDVSWTGDATPLDVNEDGWPDLYVLNMQGHDEYYENVEGKAFVRRSRDVFPRTPWGSMGVKAFDWDLDGDLDLFVTDMHSDMSQVAGPGAEKEKADMKWSESMLRSEGLSIWGNAFYRNAGEGRYEEISDSIGAETYWPWGISVADLNADGFEDVFVAAGMSYPFRYAINSVLLNDGGKRFLDSEFVLGVEPRQGPLAKPWFDFECAQVKEREHPLCRGRLGSLVVWAPLASRSSVVFDLDDDGDLDVVTNDCNSEPMILVSDLSERRVIHWLKVRLIGAKSNRDGLGAVVRVHAGGRVQTRAHDGKSGYLSHSSMPLYFGLADAAQVDRVEVRWPSGTTQVLERDLPIDALLEIREP